MAAADFDVRYVAHLARLELSADEEQKLGAQLAHILVYIEKLKEVEVSEVPSLSQEEALSNAPAEANGLFVVPKIVE